MAMVYMGGHISGAHYNRRSPWAFSPPQDVWLHSLAYWAAQPPARVLAFVAGYLISGQSRDPSGAKVRMLRRWASRSSSLPA
jgi:hypothetical protein